MANLNRYTHVLGDVDTSYFFRDFPAFTTAQDGLTSLAADSGASVAAGSSRNGVVVCTTGGTDNNEAMVRSTNALWVPIANKPIYFRAYMQYAEANTDDANIFLGLASSAGADLMIDDGGGPRTSGTLIGFYKIDGGTVWNVVTRNGSTVTTTASTATAGGSAYSLFEIEVVDWDGVSVEVVFKIDGAYLKDTNGNVIRHYVTISGATIGNAACYVKAGGANSEAVNLDFLYVAQLR